MGQQQGIPVQRPPLAVLQKPLEGAVDAILGLLGLDSGSAPTTPLGAQAPADYPSQINQIAQMLGAGAGLMGALKGAKGIKAYHGSPHDFDRFSMEKIGTGEGAQAYGHGLYFAENEGVAQTYKNVVPNARDFLSSGGRAGDVAELARGIARGEIAPDELGAFATAMARRRGLTGFEIDAVKDAAQRVASDPGFRAVVDGPIGPDWANRQVEAVQQALSNQAQRYTPRMYEVNIKADPEQMLDWDKPLSQQSEHVLNAAKRLIGDVRPAKVRDGWYSVTRVSPDGSGSLMSGDIMESSPEAAMQAFDRWITEDSGANLYRLIGNESRGPGRSSGPAVASEKLKAAGVPGIRYLDQGSRTAGEGTRNYVIFDDSLIEILRKFGIALPLAGGAAMTQQKQ